jgi:hypothetical protein
MLKRLLSRLIEFLYRPIEGDEYHCGCCWECDLETDCSCDSCEWIDLTEDNN